MTLELRPAAGESEFGDPALAGDWAAVLPAALAGEQQAPWCNYAVRRDGVLVGSGGFKGSLGADGTVEIGYLTFLPFEGQGVARAVVADLCRLAREAGAVTVVAHTLTEQNASNRALKSNGFSFEGEVVDLDDGPVWRWRHSLA